jgi:hypothetical protein
MLEKMKEWKYQEEDYINEFVRYVGSNCKLSATLVPNIKEFTEALYNDIYPEIIPEIRDKIIKHGQKLSEEQTRVLSLMSLCKKHNIYPFWGLSFDNGFRQFNEPKLKDLIPTLREFSAVYEEPNKTCVQPFQFVGNKKWYQIFLEDFIGESVEGAKIAIDGFVKDGYKLVSVFTQLNPQIYTTDHYCDYEKSDLEVFVGGGKITIYNKLPENFYMPTTKDALRDFFNSDFKPKASLESNC